MYYVILYYRNGEKMNKETEKKNVCPGCGKTKTSIKASKLTGTLLCGICRMEEYQEMRAEHYANQYQESNIIMGC